MNKPHHQNNISVMEDLVGWLVGMKDRRTKHCVDNCVYSPILHPYRSIIRNNLELGITRFVITCFAHTLAAGNMPGRGYFHRNIIDMAGIFYSLIKQ